MYGISTLYETLDHVEFINAQYRSMDHVQTICAFFLLKMLTYSLQLVYFVNKDVIYSLQLVCFVIKRCYTQFISQLLDYRSVIEVHFTDHRAVCEELVGFTDSRLHQITKYQHALLATSKSTDVQCSLWITGPCAKYLYALLMRTPCTIYSVLYNPQDHVWCKGVLYASQAHV